MNGILMDGTTYKVRVVYNSLVRSFELRSGEHEAYMISGRHERDLLGTGYAYQLAVEPDPAHPEAYDAFYEAISSPVPSHKITMPYGQGTLEFDAEILSGEDRLLGKLAGVNRWTGLVVDFQPLSLQHKPT